MLFSSCSLSKIQNSGNSAVKRETNKSLLVGSSQTKINPFCKNWRVKKFFGFKLYQIHSLESGENWWRGWFWGIQGWHSLPAPDREGRQHFRSASSNGHWLKLVMVKFSCSVGKSAVEMSISRKDRNRWIVSEKAEVEIQSITAAKPW